MIIILDQFVQNKIILWIQAYFLHVRSYTCKRYQHEFVVFRWLISHRLILGIAKWTHLFVRKLWRHHRMTEFRSLLDFLLLLSIRDDPKSNPVGKRRSRIVRKCLQLHFLPFFHCCSISSLIPHVSNWTEACLSFDHWSTSLSKCSFETVWMLFEMYAILS